MSFLHQSIDIYKGNLFSGECSKNLLSHTVIDDIFPRLWSPLPSTMKQPASLYRLSPNEAARLVQEERENRRKLRLIQVSKVGRFSVPWTVFLAATKQLYKWYFLSVRPSVRPSVCLSHLFDYVPIIVSSWNFQELLPMTKVRSMQKVKVRGQRSRSQRSQPNLTVSGL